MKPNNDTAVSLFVVSLVIALVCVPVSARITYDQEYYDMGDTTFEWITGHHTAWYVEGSITALEMRRQTILMEKQNELLAEQNELMGRLVNATEIKFECKATGYVKEPSSFNLDVPTTGIDYPTQMYIANTSDYHYNINPVDVVTCENATISERILYGCQ
jgi:hypothetical protein